MAGPLASNHVVPKGGCGVVRLAHRSAAIATVALLVTGFLRLPATRAHLAERLPALASAAGAAVLAAHHVAAAVLVAAAAVHLARRRLCVEPRPRWRLGEARLVRAFLVASLGLVAFTGAVKLAAGVAGAALPGSLLSAATHLHDLGVVLVLAGAAASLLARVTAQDGPLVPAMLASVVDASQARRRPGPAAGGGRDARGSRGPR